MGTSDVVFAEDKLTLLKEFHRRVMEEIGGVKRTTDEGTEKGLPEEIPEDNPEDGSEEGTV
jgi:hypothetical protein